MDLSHTPRQVNNQMICVYDKNSECYCDKFSQPTVQFTFYRPDLTQPEGTCKSSEDCGTKEICHIRNGYTSGICKRNAKYIKTLYFMLE